MQKIFYFILFTTLLSTTTIFGQSAASFINEVNYLASNPANRGIEIAGQAGSSLDGWSAVIYNANGTVNSVNSLGNQVIPSQQNGYGTIWYDVEQTSNGGGVALVNPSGAVQQFLSYGAAVIINAIEGPANGLTSQFIGIQLFQNKSLQLTGIGISYIDFIWALPGNTTRGGVNINQLFGILPPLFASQNGQSTVNQAVATEQSVSMEVNLYPNPVSDWLQVRLPEAAQGGERIQLFDAVGKQLYQAVFEENTTTASIDMQNLPAGNYVVKVGAATKIVVKK
ncbi:MAG: T9SS type A sorting domain-containing protein [Bacteroidetes bacterium]|nr:T9SS type A sorting domain-containing protein [Bacteroidota bacterium]